MLQPLIEQAAGHPALEAAIWFALLAAATALAAWLSRALTLNVAKGPLSRWTAGDDSVRLPLTRAIARLSTVAPALLLQHGSRAVPHLPVEVKTVVANLATAWIILALVRSAASILDAVNGGYQRRPEAHLRPIKGYLQVVKIGAYAAAAILVIAALMDRSPLLLLSGLGAMAAVLMLVFRDTILSLVASVQLSSNDMLRVGDWIEMPALNANGDVIDIALHTVKVQNFDKTITAIPTYRLINDPFKNWRGMSESGSRRIMRSLLIDQNAVRFLSDLEVRQLRRFDLITRYLDDKASELQSWNTQRPAAASDLVNARRITNIGTLRAYIGAYLRAHPRINDGLTQMVRQLEPTPDGLPLQIYCFSDTAVWAEFEAIQADVFDHLLAILPEFGLRLFQRPTGLDLRLAERGAPASKPQGEASAA
jgi:miniconductance mechanosensitive channel